MLVQQPLHRFKSISIANLKILVQSMLPHVSEKVDKANADNLSSNHIREYLEKGGKHPAELFRDWFSEDSPEAGLTYEWSLTFRDMFSYFSDEQLATTRRDWGLKELLSRETRIWIDILFIDQVLVKSISD